MQFYDIDRFKIWERKGFLAKRFKMSTSEFKRIILKFLLQAFGLLNGRFEKECLSELSMKDFQEYKKRFQNYC